MKKKSFFNGFNAKLALAVVALSSALLTGCYKDEGLDVISPDQNVTLPAAKYTITGTVVDASTLQLINNAKVNGVDTKNGSYTIEVEKPGDVVVTATAAGYTEQSTTVAVAPLKAGQAAVYPVNFALSKPAEEMKTIDAVYDLKITALDENLAVIANADVTIYGAGSTSVATGKTDANGVFAKSGLENGAYKIKVSKEGLVSTIQFVNLAKASKEVPISQEGDTYTVEYPTEIVLTKQATGTVVISGDLKFGTRWMLAKVVRLYNKQQTVQFYGEGNSNTYAYKFNVPSTEFVKKTATRAEGDNEYFAGLLKIVDENGVELTIEQEFTKPTESGEPGEEGPNVEIKVDFTFAVKIGTEIIGDAEVVKNTYEPKFFNTDPIKTKKYTYNLPMKTGAEWVKEVSYKGYDDKSALVNAVSAAMDEYLKAIVITSITDDTYAWEFKLASYEGLLKVSTEQAIIAKKVAVSSVYANVTVNGATTETPVTADLSGIYGEYNAAANADALVITPEYYQTTHDHYHTHGHGHGWTNNAGGGIIDPE